MSCQVCLSFVFPIHVQTSKKEALNPYLSNIGFAYRIWLLYESSNPIIITLLLPLLSRVEPCGGRAKYRWREEDGLPTTCRLFVMLPLLPLLSALTPWLDVISEDKLPMNIPRTIPTINVIARTRPNKLQRFVYLLLLFDDMFR
jgi:hypothetical protein